MISLFIHTLKVKASHESTFWALFVTVDSVLLVTRAIVKVSAADNVKDYYSVWRRDEAPPITTLNQ